MQKNLWLCQNFVLSLIACWFFYRYCISIILLFRVNLWGNVLQELHELLLIDAFLEVWSEMHLHVSFPFCYNSTFELVSCGQNDTREEIWDEQSWKVKDMASCESEEVDVAKEFNLLPLIFETIQALQKTSDPQELTKKVF